MTNNYPIGTILMEKQKHRRKIGVVIGINKFDASGRLLYHIKWTLEDKVYGDFEYFKEELENYIVVGYND